MKLLLLSLLSVASSCVPPGEPTLPSASVDRASIPFDYREFVTSGGRAESRWIAHTGFGVVPRKTSRKFRFYLPDDTRELVLTTCHREEFHPKPERVFEWTYAPKPGLENRGSCILTASAITGRGKLHKAIVDFSAGESLPAKLGCNGETIDAKEGVSFCQARAGLVQVLSFRENVEAIGAATCSQPYSERNGPSSWQWFVDVSPGFCVYSFRTKAGGLNRLHRLTTYGYTTEVGK